MEVLRVELYNFLLGMSNEEDSLILCERETSLPGLRAFQTEENELVRQAAANLCI